MTLPLFDKCFVAKLCKVVLFSGVILFIASNFLFKDPNCSSPYELLESSNNNLPFAQLSSSNDQNPTNLSHLVFGLFGSEKTWPHRKSYIESWWRPNVTRGYLFVDVAPSGDLLPWSKRSPPYRVSTNITTLVQETQHVAPIQARWVHGIKEILEQEHEGIRWVIMGDDDSIFFVENFVDVLAKYDHNKYYYFGGQSEYILSHYWNSFNQAFGGAGIIMSFPLAKALAGDMESCLRRYPLLRYADLIIMTCIVDFGANFSPFKGQHQIDLHGDIWGLLSSHPTAPLLSLHHLDEVAPIFPFNGSYTINKTPHESSRIRSTSHMDRCECCDIIHSTGSNKAKVKLRECFTDEKIA
ncbi:unnamed protein product [Withania somnifera]